MSHALFLLEKIKNKKKITAVSSIHPIYVVSSNKTNSKCDCFRRGTEDQHFNYIMMNSESQLQPNRTSTFLHEEDQSPIFCILLFFIVSWLCHTFSMQIVSLLGSTALHSQTQFPESFCFSSLNKCFLKSFCDFRYALFLLKSSIAFLCY